LPGAITVNEGPVKLVVTSVTVNRQQIQRINIFKKTVTMPIVTSIGLFILAGLCEIGGGYLVWLWLREGRPWWFGIIGAIILVGYGVVATWQPANFGRVYAAYGGIFITLAVIWGWKVDGVKPDKFDLLGAAIALLGVAIILYAPRK